MDTPPQNLGGSRPQDWRIWEALPQFLIKSTSTKHKQWSLFASIFQKMSKHENKLCATWTKSYNLFYNKMYAPNNVAKKPQTMTASILFGNKIRSLQ